MKTLEIKGGYANYEIDEEEKELVIDSIEVEERRKGIGTQLINELKKIANERKLKLSAAVHPLNDDMSMDELVSFYESNGFKMEYDSGDMAIMNY